MLKPAEKAGVEKASKIESHTVPYSELKWERKKQKGKKNEILLKWFG